MSMQAAKVVPFDFRSDFSYEEAEPEKVKLSPEEVLALITKVREDTIAEASRQKTEDAMERLELAAADLRSALADLTELMSIIDVAGYDARTEEKMRSKGDSLARRLLDGQGDLFAAAGRLIARLDKSPASKARSPA